jgi:hypothetical protein
MRITLEHVHTDPFPEKTKKYIDLISSLSPETIADRSGSPLSGRQCGEMIRICVLFNRLLCERTFHPQTIVGGQTERSESNVLHWYALNETL